MPARLTRRQLLQAGLVASAGGVMLDSRTARALMFGEAPGSKVDAMLVEDRRVENVLEIFLFGGLSQYESLYCVEEYGAGDSTQFHAFPTATIEQCLGACAVSGSPNLLESFAQDANGMSVKLGPFALPLRQRPDLLERLRVCVTAHDLEPHEAAVPMALTGRTVGHSAMAGLGASVERFFRERDPSHDAPHAYVLRPQSPVLFDVTRPSVATGLHPASTRPLAITIDAPANIGVLLERQNLGADRERFDNLVSANIQRFGDRLRWNGGDRVRSIRLSDLETAAATVRSSEAIREVLKPDVLQLLATDRCGKQVAHDSTTTSLKLAAYLLTHPTAPARHVCVVDGGFFDTQEAAAQAGGYDSHDDNCVVQSRNLYNLLSSLAGIINEPGETDPGKLNLDKTLVILNTEFGRTPEAQGTGRGHWPYGYPVAYLGGPIRNDNRGIYGATEPDARASTFVTPREHRVAALMALGIWPFAPESYNVSDVQEAGGEADAARSVAERVLGVT